MKGEEKNRRERKVEKERNFGGFQQGRTGSYLRSNVRSRMKKRRQKEEDTRRALLQKH